MSPGVVTVRSDICADCLTPCAWQRDTAAHADACAACPVGHWGRWDCRPGSAPLLPGDALAAQIEARVLTPIEQALPSAAPIIEAVRRCGGCAHARHALGSDADHPDPGVVV